MIVITVNLMIKVMITIINKSIIKTVTLLLLINDNNSNNDN